MATYADIDYVKLVGLMLPEEVDSVEARFPGFTAASAESVSRVLDSMLAKRYPAPFVEPYPEVLRYQAAQLLVQRIWRRNGDSPTNQSKTDDINEAAAAAMAWARDAANSKDGLVELPLRGDTSVSGVALGGPMSYSEKSPYTWTDVQADAGRIEDSR